MMYCLKASCSTGKATVRFTRRVLAKGYMITWAGATSITATQHCSCFLDTLAAGSIITQLKTNHEAIQYDGAVSR